MKTIDSLVDAFTSKLPPQVKDLGQECREFLKESLQSLLREQGLVTREEFDIQRQVLQRTRDKLKHLEEQMNKLSNTNI